MRAHGPAGVLLGIILALSATLSPTSVRADDVVSRREMPAPPDAEPLNADDPIVSAPLSTAFWVATGTAAVALTAGVVFGFVALEAQSDFDAHPTTSSANRGEGFALVADLSFGIALGAALAAIFLYAEEAPDRDPPPTAHSPASSVPRVAPMVTSSVAGATLDWRF
ncbi:MAG: hypothetical protein R3A78_13075 [Polyangiales bacterium]|nr:hypothetical protein [Myxococcales bacterium]